MVPISYFVYSVNYLTSQTNLDQINMFYVLKSSSKVAALVIEAKYTETAVGLEHALSPGVLYFLHCLKLGSCVHVSHTYVNITSMTVVLK